MTLAKKADVIVVGASGAMGSATTYYLAQRGLQVIGLDRFPVGHNHGSSHGETRLIRQAYFEDSRYVPLLKRAYKLWDALDKETGEKFRHENGLVIFGNSKDTQRLTKMRESSEKYNVTLDEVSGEESKERFPLFKVPDGYTGLYEPTGGYLEVEKCVERFGRLAEKAGANLIIGDAVTQWAAPDRDTVEVIAGGTTYTAQSLVICPGAWAGDLLDIPGAPIKAHRVPLFWFKCDERFSEASGLPCFAFELPYGFYYGFPGKDGRIKVALHRTEGTTLADPLRLDRTPDQSDRNLIERFRAECLPEVGGDVVGDAMCIYSMTPDENFVIDRHPGHENVVIGAGFSGHGFKFSSSVGEMLAELATGGKPDPEYDFLRWRWS